MDALRRTIPPKTKRLLCVLMACAVAAMGTGGCMRLLAPLGSGSAQRAQQPAGTSAALIRVATCWEGLPLAQALVEAYAANHPDVSFDLVPGSNAMAQALVDAGQADLAILAQGLGQETKDSALSPSTLALDAIAIVVHRDSPIQGISLGDLQALYGGYRLDWAELGALQGRPALVTRESGSVARLLFEEVVMGQEPISSAAILMPHDRAVLEYVSAHPLAVGHLARCYLDEGVHALALEGALPTEEAIRAGSYPLRLALTIEMARNASGEVARFLSFATGARGREIASQRYVASR